MSQQNTKKTVPAPSSQTSDSKAKPWAAIKTWKPELSKPTFYIQAKGDHAGRPLRSPIANCWAVYTNIPNLYEIVFSIYLSGHLRTMNVGSVIPFLRLGEYRKIMERVVQKGSAYDRDHLRTLEMIETLSSNLIQQLDLLSNYKQALAHKINRQINVF